MEKRKWYIYRFESGYYAGDTEFEGTLEEAKKFAWEWASKGHWEEPVVRVWVELWDGNPRESGTERVGGWEQFSYDPSKPDPYRKVKI